jgi:hypothetical protein
LAFAGRVSSGVQLAGSDAGAGGAGVAAAVAVPPTVPLAFVFDPGLAQPAASVHAANAPIPRRTTRGKVEEEITVMVE